MREVSEEMQCHKFQNIFKLFSSVFQGLPFCISVTKLVPEPFLWFLNWTFYRSGGTHSICLGEKSLTSQ